MNINYAEGDTINNIQKITVQEKSKKLIEKRIVYKITKRITDILGAIIGIIVTIPLAVIVFILNLITKDKGPIFYVQNRIGKNGKAFKMYKFRSMELGAEERLQEYLDAHTEAKEEYRINKKLKNDTRVTKVGDFIRRTSIDEFPQFMNVLKGDMSLVGPRPYLCKEIEDIGEYYQYITKVKPGITGLWQVSGRNDVSLKKRLELDKEYLEKRGIIMDFKILIKTVFKLFKNNIDIFNKKVEKNRN